MARAMKTYAGYAAAFAAVLWWLLWWMFRLGPTLINDEYAAIDYFHRMVEGGGLYPTPDRLHKPFSILLGFFSWITGSPLGFEAVMCVFGAAFVLLVYAVVRREFGPLWAAVSAIAVAINPDLMYLSVTGSTVVPFSALSFAGLYAVQRKEEGRGWIWVYAVSFLLAGLLRPESWLFGAPLLLYWWPVGKGRETWVRLIIAGAIISLGPVIWFGKDVIINDNLMHGIEVSARAKEIGTGQPFGALKSLDFFRIRIPHKLGVPVSVAGLFGLVLFIWRRGPAGLLHPFVVFPAIVAAYVWLIVIMGVYPVHRYWYYDAVFLIFFTAYLCRYLIARFRIPVYERFAAAAIWAATISAAAVITTRPGADTARWLVLAIALVAAAGAGLFVFPYAIYQRVKGALAVGVVTLLALAYGLFLFGFYDELLSELELEAEIQREMKDVAVFLDNRIDAGTDYRILIPSRRNEQLNWLWRYREIPAVVTFRLAFYLDYFKDVDFLELYPDWIVYIDNDYQFWGPGKLFKWLEYQDRTELHGVVIKLEMESEHVRVFSVDYPEGRPEVPPPLPEVP